jgi:uncharacterized protein with beta-barrel porin domain
VSISVNPSTVAAGAKATGTVTLNASPGPRSGAVLIKLVSNSKSVVVPASVSVLLNKATAPFAVTTKGTYGPAVGIITGTYLSGTQTATLTVTAADLASISVSPSTVQGSSRTVVTGTATLSGPAPIGGEVISLTSSNTGAATVLASVTIPAGTTRANFTVTHKKVTASTTVTITGKLGTTTRTGTLTVTP